MHAENDKSVAASSPTPPAENFAEESLTDVIDRLDRTAFQRALARRPDAASYRRTIEAAYLVRVTSS